MDHQELAEAGQVDEVGKLAPRRVEGRRVAPDERLGPIEVMRAAVTDLQGPEQGVVVQPVGLIEAEALEGGAQALGRPRPEVGPRPLEQSVLEPGDGRIIDLARRERRHLQLARAEEAVGDQAVGADEEDVARERGQGLVGRVAVPRGPQRQRLPPRLARSGEAIDPRERRRAEVADAVRGRQRGHVQQDAGGAVARPERRRRHAQACLIHGPLPPGVAAGRPPAPGSCGGDARGAPRARARRAGTPRPAPRPAPGR